MNGTPCPIGRRRLLRRLGGAAAALALPSLARSQAPALRVQLVPYLSTRAMLNVYEPLRGHLEAKLGRPVEFGTASDFRALFENARRQPGFALMPVHLARILVHDAQHHLVLRSTRLSAVQLMAPRRLALAPTADGLRGRRIATLDPLSVTTLLFRRWLVAQRLEPLVRTESFASANSALLALRAGHADAMVAAVGQLRDIPGHDDADLVGVATVGSVPTPAFVAHPDVPEAERLAFRAAVLSFVPGSEAAGASGAGFVAGQPGDLEPFEDEAAEARLLLALPRPPR